MKKKINQSKTDLQLPFAPLDGISLGGLLHFLRQRAGVGLRAAAARLGVSHGQLSRLENSERYPSRGLLMDAATLYDFDTETVLLLAVFLPNSPPWIETEKGKKLSRFDLNIFASLDVMIGSLDIIANSSEKQKRDIYRIVSQYGDIPAVVADNPWALFDLLTKIHLPLACDVVKRNEEEVIYQLADIVKSRQVNLFADALEGACKVLGLGSTTEDNRNQVINEIMLITRGMSNDQLAILLKTARELISRTNKP